LRERIAQETKILPQRQGLLLPFSFLQMGVAFAGLVIILLGASGLFIGGQQVLLKGHSHLGVSPASQTSPAPLISVTIIQPTLRPTATPTPTIPVTPTPSQKQHQHSIFEEAFHKVVNNVFHISQFGQSNKEKSSNDFSSHGHGHN
jgi:hypothetical protein